MFKNFRVDIDRSVVTDNKSWLLLLLTKEGLWALAEYRFNHWVDQQLNIPIFHQILALCGAILHKVVMLITGIELPKKTEIGKGLYIAHAGCVVLHPQAKLGEYCTLSQNVTIGMGGRGKQKGCPTLGNRVYIAPGAKIFGSIKIGNDVAIGANAVVTKDIPDNAVAVGIPAKIISYNGSQDFIVYRDKPVSSVNTLTEKSDCGKIS